MAAEDDIIYPSTTTLIRARTDQPVRITAGGAILYYGSTIALGSTLSAGQSLTRTTDIYVRAEGAVLLHRFNDWEIPFQSIYDVTDYGAVGDGATDDRQAINNAISTAVTAGGGVVYFPPGTYNITDSLLIAGDDVVLSGGGWGTIIIADSSWGTAANEMIDALNGSTGVTNVQIENLKIDCNFKSDTGIAIQYNSASELGQNKIQNVWVRGHYKTGISLGGNSNEVAGHVEDCFIDGTSSSAGHTSQRGIWTQVGSGSMKIYRNRINNNREAGIYIEGGGNQIEGNHIFANGSLFTSSNYPTCIKIRRGSLHQITGNYFDNARQNHMIVLATDTGGQALNDTQITNNTFICAFAMRDGTDSGNSNYSVVGIDSTVASIANVQILNNIGSATTTTPWTGIVDYTSTSASMVDIASNAFRNITTVSDSASLTTRYSNNMLMDTSGTLYLGGSMGGFYTFTDAASVTPDAALADYFYLNVLANANRTINAPSNIFKGQILEFEIRNGSGGAYASTFTWNAQFKLAGAWTMPGNGASRTIRFRVRSTSQVVEISRGAADITTSV